MEEAGGRSGEGAAARPDREKRKKGEAGGNTHVKATRPVDLLMPSQVPPASMSRPESTLPLCSTLSSADE